jgi:hypothetical protein
MIHRPPTALSLLRRRLAWLSIVRVATGAWYPHTARRSSCLREDTPGLAGKVDEQAVLHLAQSEVFVVEAGRVGVGVDPQRADPEHPIAPGAVGAAQDGPQTGA